MSQNPLSADQQEILYAYPAIQSADFLYTVYTYYRFSSGVNPLLVDNLLISTDYPTGFCNLLGPFVVFMTITVLEADLALKSSQNCTKTTRPNQLTYENNDITRPEFRISFY